MKSKAVKVRLKDAEKIRRFLTDRDAINRELKPLSNKNHVYIPVKKVITEINSDKIVEKDFQKFEKKPSSYIDLLKLPRKIMEKLPKSYDIIGEVILVKISDELANYKREIGKALLAANKNIRSVYLSNPVSGDLRTREIEIIAGEKNSKTCHFEYGVKFELDIKKTYFSPRLANERKRISDKIIDGEVVVDMFTGVAPFPIIIAKYSNPRIIYAIDINKNSIKYAKTNVSKNQVLDKIEIIKSDAAEIKNILDKKGVKADRIIMNLPFKSHLFFKNALEIASNLCVIHYYDILPEYEIDNRIGYLKKISKKQYYELVDLKVNKIKTYAPRVFYIGIDITAKKNADVA
jgi:tRNA (guanine37-N1)-methyltransferase